MRIPFIAKLLFMPVGVAVALFGFWVTELLLFNYPIILLALLIATIIGELGILWILPPLDFWQAL